MTPYPIILVCGNAGSGKDTVADQIVSTIPNSIKLAQADEMKRFAGKVFKFTDEQLWGPSHMREEVDERYDHERQWQAASKRLYDALPDFLQGLGIYGEASESALIVWFRDLPREELTPRYVLQTLGTEFGRAQKYDLWTAKATADAEKLLNGGHKYTRSEGLYRVPGTLPYDLVVITDGRFRNEVLNVKKLGGFIVKVVPPNAPSNAGKHQSESELDNIPFSWFSAIIENNKEHGLAGLSGQVGNMLTIAVPSAVYYKTFHPSKMAVNPNTKAILDI